MVQRGHAKNALPARGLEIAHLQNHGEGFRHEQAAHDEQEQFLLAKHREKGQHAAEPERPHVAHEHLGGIGVEPEEPKPRASQRTAENSDLAHPGNVFKLQVLREPHMPRDVNIHRKHQPGDDHRADSQPVEPVRQIHRVGSPHHDQHGERDVPVPEIRVQGLEERERQPRGIGRFRHQQEHGDPGHQHLTGKFRARAETFVLMVGYLHKIVDEPHRRKPDEHQHGHPYIGVGQVRPQQHAHAHREHDEQAAHRGGPGLALVRLHFLEDFLTALDGLQPADEIRPDEDTYRERRHKRPCGAEGDVFENVEDGIVNAQRIQQVIQHGVLPPVPP